MSRLTKREDDVVFIKKAGCVPCEEVCDYTYSCSDCPIDEAFRKLAHYEDLEEQGRLIELPCKVGDRVWEIHHRAWEGYADDWLYPDYTRSIVQECGFSLSLLSSIGSTVFLTKAEAEAKLAELKGGGSDE